MPGHGTEAQPALLPRSDLRLSMTRKEKIRRGLYLTYLGGQGGRWLHLVMVFLQGEESKGV